MKTIVGILAILLVMSVLLVGCISHLETLKITGEIPAPFQKVKEFCLRSQPDADGDYILSFPGIWKGEKVEYILGYFPRLGVVGIGLRNENGAYVIEFYETTCRFAVYSNGAEYPIEEELAIERAFLIFRELVSAKII